ncbi:MAG: hypothetical protein K6F94_06995 [Bacteroidaceae bacterium]|nr:hypothetical protein [Bacteroidaceae bacterium]
MKATHQTIQQIQRALHKVADKFPQSAEPVLTDIHLQAKPGSGELIAYNDDMEELTRVVIEEWIDVSDDNFYEEIVPVIKQCIKNLSDELEQMAILHPFSFVLIDEDAETITDIYLFDDNELIFDTELLKGLDKELDEFLNRLMAD